ncbi:MAG: hypothetical protein E7414_05825 [Ruminococcaceae bacterium]|nr:hypothetical protein [Oscillospiraceae bacterium]
MELHYFLTTNGSLGHVSFLETAFAGYHDVIRLEGYPRTLAAKLVRECYAESKKRNLDLELIHNPLDNSPEGILLPSLGTALINIPLYDAKFSLPALFVNDNLGLYMHHIEKAHRHFKEALAIHDDWEKIYIQATDYTTLNDLTERIINTLLTGIGTDYKGALCDRFFGSATISGSIDYVELLSEGLKRYYIKGRPGTGKSTFMKKLALAACEKGFHVERYHCSFDPNSLDMVIIREPGICVFDSTAPHEYFPTAESDEIIDLYQEAVLPGTDETYEKELSVISQAYKDAIGRAVKHLMVANEAALSADEAHMKYIDNERVLIVLKEAMQRLFP